MIFQVKITLEDVPGPVWRRLEIDSEITFSELHDVLQVAFYWENAHLHNFEVKRKDGKRCKRIYIEDKQYDEFEENLDEEEEIVEDWLIKEKDQIMYTYDFGDNWEHTIELEKIVERRPERNYPYCVKAIRVAPEEDSRFDLLAGNVILEKVPSNVLTEEVNMFFREMLIGEKDDGFDYLRIQLLSTAKKFNATKPWLQLDALQMFMIHDQEFDEPFYCGLFGADDSGYGVIAYIGEEGLQTMTRSLTEQISEVDLFNTPCFIITFNDRDEIEDVDYEFIKRVDFSFRGKKQWPAFTVFEPDEQPALPDIEQMDAMISIMEQTMELMKQVEKEEIVIPLFGTSESIICREGTYDEWETIARPLQINIDFNSDMLPLYVSELELKRIKKLKKHAGAIELGLLHIEGPDDESAIMIIFVDEMSGLVLYQELAQMMNMEEFQRSLLSSFQNAGFCPTKVNVLSGELHMVEKLFHALDCEVNAASQLPSVEEYIAHMENDLFD